MKVVSTYRGKRPYIDTFIRRIQYLIALWRGLGVSKEIIRELIIAARKATGRDPVTGRLVSSPYEVFKEPRIKERIYTWKKNYNARKKPLSLFFEFYLGKKEGPEYDQDLSKGVTT